MFFWHNAQFFEIHADSIERYLFAEVARCDPNFKRFAHFNKIAEVSNKRSKENSVPINPEEYTLLKCDAVAQTDQEIVDQQIDFEQMKKYGDNWRDNFGSLKNLLRQFYSLNAVTDLIAQQKFDLVIFSRVDIRFESPIEIPLVRPGTLYTPWFDKYHGLNDRFAMGDFDTMVTYGRRQSRIREYCEQTGRPLGAEAYLRWYVRSERLRSRDLTSVNFSRVRAHGVVSPIDRSAKAKLKYHLKKGLEVVGLR